MLIFEPSIIQISTDRFQMLNTSVGFSSYCLGLSCLDYSGNSWPQKSMLASSRSCMYVKFESVRCLHAWIFLKILTWKLGIETIQNWTSLAAKLLLFIHIPRMQPSCQSVLQVSMAGIHPIYPLLLPQPCKVVTVPLGLSISGRGRGKGGSSEKHRVKIVILLS